MKKLLIGGPVNGVVGQCCPLCNSSEKKITLNDRKCAFINSAFSSDNWNCATANALRELVNEPIWHEDQHLGILKFPDQGRFIVLSWYKSRGQIESIQMNYGNMNGPLTLKGAMVMLGLEEIEYEGDVVMSLPNPEGSRGGTEAAVTSQPPSSAAQVHPVVGRCLPFPEYLKGG